MNLSFCLGVLIVGLALSGCSSNGSSNSNSSGSSSSSSGGEQLPLFPPDTDWSVEIEKDLSQFSVEELKLIFGGYSKQLYQGSTEPKVATPKLLHQVTSMVLGSKSLRIPQFDYGLIISQPELFCSISGEMNSSMLSDDGISVIYQIEYNQCENEGGTISGSSWLTIAKEETLSNYGMNGIVFFKNAVYSNELDSWSLTGYHFTYANVADGVLWQEESSQMLYQNLSTDIAFLTDDIWNKFTTALTGSARHSIQVHLQNEGLMEIESGDGIVYNFISGDNIYATLDFSYLLKVLVDTDASGSFDSGNYFINLENFLSEDIEQNPLVAIDEMKQPPIIQNLVLNTEAGESSFISPEEAIVMTFDYSDADTANEDLQLSYSWLLSGDVVPEQTDLTLPGGIAEDGTQVQGVIYISDGDFSFSIISDPVNIVQR